MISTDKNIFNEHSEVRQRVVEYGGLVEELHIIIFTGHKYQITSTKSQTNYKLQITNNIFTYPTNSRNKLFYIFDAIKIGKKILDSSGQWLVTSQDPFETGLAGWLIARKAKTPLQIQIHTDFLSPYFVQHSMLNRLRVWIAKFLIKRADCIRVVSTRIENSIYRIMNHELRIINLPIFVDAEKIQQSPVNVDLHKKYPQFDFIILMASRFTKEKNILMAINAMSEVVKQYPKMGLVIVGDGPEERNLKSKISNLSADRQDLKVNENVKIENWTDDLTSCYKTADLFLLTSDYEGYGRTLIEAASAGCNIISSNVGIANEVLEKENIFEPGNREQLKEKIVNAVKGDIKPPKAPPKQTKEQYLLEYKKTWETCGY